MPIIEKRIFSFKGQQFTKDEITDAQIRNDWLLRTTTLDITDLREYRDEILGHIKKKLYKRYEGRRGWFFLLDDDRMVVLLLGSTAEALAATNAPLGGQHVAAD